MINSNKLLLSTNFLMTASGFLFGSVFKDTITSFADDIIVPLISIFFNIQWNTFSFVLNNYSINYGLFLSQLFYFLLLIFVFKFFILDPLWGILQQNDAEIALETTKEKQKIKKQIIEELETNKYR